MQFQKVSIIKNEIDIGRIIPFNPSEGEYDFKISFSENDYEVNFFTFLSVLPEKIEISDTISWEITYHRSARLKPTVIHLKEKSSNPKYKTLPLKRLKDPSIHNEFPIPFMKIEIPSNFKGKKYKPKVKEHVIFDMEAANVAEFYLTHINFDFDLFAKKWPTISLKLMVSSFEFFATNDLLTDKYKLKYFMPTGDEIRTFAKMIIVNKDMGFFVNIYKNPEFFGEKIIVTFIENEFADALMGLSQIGYENNQGRVEMLSAYKEDLRRDTMSKKEKQKWEYRFNKMQQRLEREIKRNPRGSFQ